MLTQAQKREAIQKMAIAEAVIRWAKTLIERKRIPEPYLSEIKEIVRGPGPVSH